MQVTFDTTNEKDVQDVQALVNMLTGGKTVVDNSAKTAEDKAPVEDKPKAPTAAQKKAAQKKIDDAAAAKVAEEEAAAAAAAEAEEAKPENSRDDVRAKLKEYAALEGKDGAIQILKDHGAASITELAEDQFDLVVAACG